MKKKLLCILWCGSALGQISPHIITFFIRPLPASLRLSSEQKADLSSPLKEKKMHPRFLHTGIYVSYAGTFGKSDTDGQVIFERKTPEVKLNVLITEDVNAVPVDPLNNKTIYGFALDPNAQSQHYLYERLQDPETELYSWHVTQIPLPKSKRIPYDTIIIFANPKHIVVPLGSTITLLSENFVLPDFYATESHFSAENALRFLKIRHYFSPVRFDYKFIPDGFQQRLRY